MTQRSGHITKSLRSNIFEIDGVEVLRESSLAPRTTFRIGGPAEILVKVKTESALRELSALTHQVSTPVHVLGLGSNILIPAEGVSGVVVLLVGEFQEFAMAGDRVDAGGGVALARLAKRAAEQDLVGLEALAGFPSSVGGAVVINAGCYGVEIIEVLESIRVVEPGGTVAILQPQDLDAKYRRTRLQGTGSLVSRATFRLQSGDGVAALKRMAEINRKRRSSLPSGKPNAGSIFKNPPGNFAGHLIEACNLKGLQRGGAEISERHANVIVNNGDATAQDVVELMLLAYRAVNSKYDVALEPELILVGELRERWAEGIG